MGASGGQWQLCGCQGDSVVGQFWCLQAAPAPSSLTLRASVPSRDPAGVVMTGPFPRHSTRMSTNSARS